MGREGLPSLLIRGAVSVPSWFLAGAITFFSFLLILAVYLVRLWVDPDQRRIHGITSLWARALVTLAGARVRVFGREHLPRGRACILMANHQSYTDIPVLYSIRRHFKWVADEALFQIPVLGWSMRMAGYVPIRRGDPHKGLKALEKARGWLAKGVSILVFPEGTRSRTGALGRFQTGGFRLAVTSGTPIVPMVVIGTRQFLPRGSWLLRLGRRVQIHILPAVPPSPSAREVRPLANRVKTQMAQAYRRHLQHLR